MSFRFTIGLCAIILVASSLTLCQPPRPRIATVEVPPFPTVNYAATKDILTASSLAERAIKVRDPDGPLSSFSKRSR